MMRQQAGQMGQTEQQLSGTLDCLSTDGISLSQEEISTLLFMIEEEKMAGDIYEALYEQTSLPVFNTISLSEDKHMDALLNLASKFDIDTSAISGEIGVFSNDDIQNLYDTLLDQASTSVEDALNVGYNIEETDIADLQAAIEATDITLIGQVYSHLLDGSSNHLEAFDTYLG